MENMHTDVRVERVKFHFKDTSVSNRKATTKMFIKTNKRKDKYLKQPHKVKACAGKFGK